MQIVRQFNNTYATAYLLEKAGDIHGAFQLLLEVRITFPSENGNFLFITLLLVKEHTKVNQRFLAVAVLSNMKSPYEDMLSRQLWVSLSTRVNLWLDNRSRPQVSRSFWSTLRITTWEGPTPEVHDSRTSRQSAHAQSQVWQSDWLRIRNVFSALCSQNWTFSEVAILGVTEKSAATGNENVE